MENKEKRPKKPKNTMTMLAIVVEIVCHFASYLWDIQIDHLTRIESLLIVIGIALLDLREAVLWERDKDVVINDLSIQVIKDKEEE